jgi:hypothetical protein
MDDLPKPVAELVKELSAMPGTVAVALGGSRAFGITDAGTDWDLGLYYRDTIDLTALAAHGTVHPPGSWGRLMNGGAWLEVGGERVDVLLRDLTVVEHWTARAERGEFELDALLGYTAGVPTYLLTAELALGRVLYGTLPTMSFPPALVAAAPDVWRFCRSFSIEYARVHATRGNHAGAVAQAAKAVMEEGHAVMCAQGRWVCNEKRLIDDAGLTGVQSLFGRMPSETPELVRWVDAVADRLGVPPGDAMPWKPRA